MCRSWVKTQYPELKKLNPTLPLLVREAKGVQPRITARFGTTTYHLSLPPPPHTPLFCSSLIDVDMLQYNEKGLVLKRQLVLQV
jgi:hypothetical protein